MSFSVIQGKWLTRCPLAGNRHMLFKSAHLCFTQHHHEGLSAESHSCLDPMEWETLAANNKLYRTAALLPRGLPLHLLSSILSVKYLQKNTRSWILNRD